MGRPRFHLADTAQQVLGGFLLAGPFVVTEEVWTLARAMTWLHALGTVGIVVAVGYGALYEADVDRDPDREADVAGVPVRFVSLLAVAYGSVLVLTLLFAVPETFLGDLPAGRQVPVVARGVGVGAIFSVVGAATADSLF